MENLVDFRKQLTERLKDPDYKKCYEQEQELANIELLVNDVLRDTGNEKYCVSLIEVENY